MLGFIYIYYILGGIKNSTGGAIGASGGNHQEKVFQRAKSLTMFIWLGYPIVWILAEGTDTISVEAEAIAYTVLDIIAKTFLGIIIATTEWQFATTSTVTGTGSECDGNYTITGNLYPSPEDLAKANITTVTPRLVWQHDTNKNVTIVWAGSVWMMQTEDGGGASFLNRKGSTMDPPSSGWFPSGGAQINKQIIQ